MQTSVQKKTNPHKVSGAESLLMQWIFVSDEVATTGSGKFYLQWGGKSSIGFMYLAEYVKQNILQRQFDIQAGHIYYLFITT